MNSVKLPAPLLVIVAFSAVAEPSNLELLPWPLCVIVLDTARLEHLIVDVTFTYEHIRGMTPATALTGIVNATNALRSYDNLLLSLAGNAGGYLKTGRFVSMPGKPHNNVLVTIANAMGVAVKTFGDPTLCDGGSIPGLLA